MSFSKFEYSIVDQFLQTVALTSESEDKRASVFEAIREVLSEVIDDSVVICRFGSGPLKTYLPDSDIDITLLYTDTLLKPSSTHTPSSTIGLPDLNILKNALEKNETKLMTEDVSIINAEVKLIKLYSHGIPIDISFNQIGGLCTLEYLEKIDEIIGDDHLFKKSILIIKAW
jgi:DNA polymerase sigma